MPRRNLRVHRMSHMVEDNLQPYQISDFRNTWWINVTTFSFHTAMSQGTTLEILSCHDPLCFVDVRFQKHLYNIWYFIFMFRHLWRMVMYFLVVQATNSLICLRVAKALHWQTMVKHGKIWENSDLQRWEGKLAYAAHDENWHIFSGRTIFLCWPHVAHPCLTRSTRMLVSVNLNILNCSPLFKPVTYKFTVYPMGCLYWVDVSPHRWFLIHCI